MKKMILMGSAVTVLMFTGCVGQVTQLMNSGVGQQMASSQSQAATMQGVTDSTKATGVANLKKGCFPRMGGGSVSLFDLVKKKSIEFAVDKALEGMEGMENVKLPAKILDTCEAEERLSYIKQMNENLLNNVDKSNRKLASSVEQTKEIQKLQAEMDHNKKNLEKAEYLAGVTDNTDEILRLVKKGKILNKKMFSESMGYLGKAATKNASLLVLWDKEILEFSKDTIPWALKNISEVKTIATQVTSLVKISRTGTNLVQSKFYNGRVDKKVADTVAKNSILSSDKVASKANF